ncbi:hypothetical protein [Streptomyces sp. NPDC087298]|uniref:hypothetical protein n=1 Tax=Streptomyces sp. NPDC087298 TaxID=3365779 RepID=UPI003818B44C
MPDKDPCALLKDAARQYCNSGQGKGAGGGDGADSGLTDGASSHVQDLAQWLITKVTNLVAPGRTWAPQSADNPVYQSFMWLGQHLAIAIFVCVIVVCALTAWQGAPRLQQMGNSTGWTLVAVTGMASVPGAVVLLNNAVAQAFTAAFDSDEVALFSVIRADLKSASDSGNPLAILCIVSALCVALAFAGLVFMTRQPGILVFVCMAPLILASLARGGDMSAVQAWAQRLLGLMFAPFALLLVAPFVSMARGSLVLDTVLLVAADVLMLRMVFHGVPYFGPKVAGLARSMVESRTDNRVVRGIMKAGSPDVWEQESIPRQPRMVPTPKRAMGQDSNALAAAYGLKARTQPGRMTTASAIAQVEHDAERRTLIMDARRAARTAHNPRRPANANSRPTPGSPPSAGAGGPTTP